MRRIKSTAVHSGLNSEHVALQDNKYIRCAKCGFICHLDRDTRAEEGSTLGYGVNLTDNTFTTSSDAGWGDQAWGDFPWGGLETRIDPTVTAGCPMCGTYLYHK